MQGSLSRCILFVASLVFAVLCATDSAYPQVHVRGYYRKNGTYVKPHYRSNPDGNFSNNWSTKGNYNPYTGKYGTKVTPPDSSGSSRYGDYRQRENYRSPVVTNPFYARPAALPAATNVDNPYATLSSTELQHKRIENLALAECAENVLREIETLDYHGVGFATSEQVALEVLTTASLNKKHPGFEQGIRTYEIHDDDCHDCVLLRYFENALVEVDYISFPQKVAARGGAVELTRWATERLGPPTKQSKQATLWDVPESDRIVVTSFEKGNWSLHVYHRQRRLAIPDYKDATVQYRLSSIIVSNGYNFPHQAEVLLTTDSPADPPSEPSTLLTGNHFAQSWTAQNQANDLVELQELTPPAGMSELALTLLKLRVRMDHPDDTTTQLQILRDDLTAFEKLRSLPVPQGVAESHFYKMKASAALRHSTDYSTQLYVLEGYIKEYLLRRQADNSAESLTAYLHRFD